MGKYRGDTFIFDLFITKEEVSQKFLTGDIVRVGVKKDLYQTEYDLYREIQVDEDTDSIEINFSKDETEKLRIGEYQIEIELTRAGIVETIYRNSLKILGDVINGTKQ